MQAKNRLSYYGIFKRMLSIAIIVAMLISTFAIFPITPVAQAAAADVTVSIDYPYIVMGHYIGTYPAWAASHTYKVGDRVVPTTPNGYYYECTTAGTSGATEPTWPTTIEETVTDGTVTWKCKGEVVDDPKRTITVSNPLGNPGITRIEIQVPKDAFQADSGEIQGPQGTFPEAGGFVQRGSPSTAGSGPWVISYPPAASGATILPGGAAGKLTISIDPKDSATASGVAEKFDLVVAIIFVDGSVQYKTVSIYEGEADTITMEVTTASPYKVGQALNIKATLKKGTSETVCKGIPLVFIRTSPSLPEGFTDSFSPKNVVTGDTNYVTTTYTTTYAHIGYAIKADAGTRDTTFSNDEGILTVTPVSFGVNPEVPSKVAVTVWQEAAATNALDDPASDITYLTQPSVYVRAELADKYGNPVTVSGTTEVTFSIVSGGGTLASTKATIPQGDSKSGTVAYTPVTDYGAYAMIGAKLEIEGVTYSGNSKPLCTSTFATTFTVSPDATSVEAGKYATITVQLSGTPAQKGVPVTFSLAEYTEGYAGFLNVTTAYTDSSGKAYAKLTVDTVAYSKTKVNVTVAQPLSSNPDNVLGSTLTDAITTVPGSPSALVVETYEYATPAPSFSNLKAKLSIGPGEKLYVVVYLADSYGNIGATNELGSSIQVSLSASAGALSTTTAYISSGAANTWESDPPYVIVFTAPSGAGNVTIRATTPQGYTAGEATVSVVSLSPTVVITQPAADTIIQTNETSVSVYIAGYAKASTGQPSGTYIALIQYSLNGAANKTAPIVAVEEGKYKFNFTIALNVNTTNTIVVYAKDNQDVWGASAPRVIEVSKAVAPVYWSEVKQPKTLDATGSPKTSFRMGETVIVSANVTNVDTVSHSMLIAVQIKDPDGTVLPTQYVIVTLAPGQSIAPALSSIIPATGYRAGTWTAKIMVLTTWPAQGGVSIAAPVEITFTVTS